MDFLNPCMVLFHFNIAMILDNYDSTHVSICVLVWENMHYESIFKNCFFTLLSVHTRVQMVIQNTDQKQQCSKC